MRQLIPRWIWLLVASRQVLREGARKKQIIIKYCNLLVPSCFILPHVCGMRLQGNRFRGRVPKSVGGPQRSNNPTWTQKSSIAKRGKCGNISLELVLQHSNHQFPHAKKEWYIAMWELLAAWSFDWHQNWRSFQLRLWMHLEISSYEDPRVMSMVSRRNICTYLHMGRDKNHCLLPDRKLVYLIPNYWFESVFCISLMAMPPFSGAQRTLPANWFSVGL